MAEELEVPYPKAVRDFPTIRQSLLAQFDSCALWTKLDLDYRDGWSGHPQARGTIFHRMAAKSLQQMADMEEKMIAPGDALAILRECLRQHDVVPEDVVTIPFSQIKDLRWVTIKWANENIFDVEHLASVEDRLNTPIEYESPMGMVRRVLTGQLDALFIPEPDHAIVVDWKDAQPLDAKILTPAGWTTMGQLNAGDLVIGSDGKPTEVLGVHPKGERLVYEVEFTDGSKTRCCDHHWWKVRRSGCNWQIKRLSELIGHERQGTGYWQVPAPKPVEFDRQDELPLDPYLLGVLLGDGDFPSEASVGLTTADDEIVEAVRAALPEGMTTQHAARYNWRLTADSRAERNPLRKALVSLGLMGCKAADKFVPPNYLFGDPAQRFDLLCGLMDTDGTIDKDGRMSFCSASAEMAEQVQFLVRSLGGFATRKVWPRPGHHDTNVVYFRMDRAPFRLARKKGRWRKPTKGMTRGIRAIRPLTVEPVQCIEVAAEDSLYATDDLILTHNTWALPRESEVSDRGYFQQRFYGMLVMTRYPAIQRVTLRETYVRLKDKVTEAAPVREATVFRSELEDIRDEMAALAERFDRAVEHGKWPLKEGEKPELWTPAPGSHCFGGETEVLTNRGVRTLRELEGKTTRVLDRHGKWVKATGHSFGRQPLSRVRFDDGSEVRATPDHRWWKMERDRLNGGWVQTDERITTAELDRAPLTAHAEMPGVDPEGVRHGIVYGDGYLRKDRGWSQVLLQPHKAELADYFDNAPVLRPHGKNNGAGKARQMVTHHPVKDKPRGCKMVTMQPAHYKELPTGKVSPGYARGFIAGLLATDGAVSKANGDTVIHQEGFEVCQRIAKLARLGGCVVSSVRVTSRKTPEVMPGGVIAPVRERELSAVRLKPATAPVIRSEHRANLKAKNQMRGLYRQVESIVPDEDDEVFCLTVPGSESFTLANGLATSNCAWCPRPTACPIFPDARVQGAIENEDQAKLWAGQSIVAKAAQKQRDEALRAWANVHGAIPVRNAKDSSRVLGYREQKRTSRPKAEEVERLVREQGEYADVQSLYKTTTVTRFDQHSPTEGESVPDAPEDLPLVEALEQSLAEQKAQSADTPKEP